MFYDLWWNDNLLKLLLEFSLFTPFTGTNLPLTINTYVVMAYSLIFCLHFAVKWHSIQNTFDNSTHLWSLIPTHGNQNKIQKLSYVGKVSFFRICGTTQTQTQVRCTLCLSPINFLVHHITKCFLSSMATQILTKLEKDIIRVIGYVSTEQKALDTIAQNLILW